MIKGMGRSPDRKLEHLAGTLLRDVCDADAIRVLAAAGDLVARPAGTRIHDEAERNHWSYLLLDGNVALTQHGDPLALSAPGTWFPIGAGRPTNRPRATLTAVSDVELLVFRWRDLDAALDRVPALAALSSAASGR